MSEHACDIAATLAACPHYGLCGGCIDITPKTDRLPRALTQAGLADPPPIAATASLPYTRRRMDLAVRRTPKGVALGLHRHRSHDIVDLRTCHILHPSLVHLFGPLREALPRCDLLRRGGAVIGNLTDSGIDLLLRTDGQASTADRTRLAGLALKHDIARISHATAPTCEPETLVMRTRPMLLMSGVVVHPPPGAFLQATTHGEQSIVAAVLAGLPDRLTRRAKVAELYAGIGTLTFAMAAIAQVHAYEANAAALACLNQAARTAMLDGRITAHLRDLNRQPLAGAELAPFAAVVLDPPAVGALPQIRLLAEARVRRLIYVSCNPETLSRDAAVLRQLGYQLRAATTINQFLGATRVESVCVFDLPG